MIVENELQTSTQQAIAKASLAKQIAEAVITETAGEYLHGSELYHKPLVRKLVRDAGQLSVVLSDAYGQGLVGREFAPMGKERYAYGAPGKTAGQPAQKRVIKSLGKPLLGYAVTITKKTADEVLALLEQHPHAKFKKHQIGLPSEFEYQVSLTFNDKGDALDFMIESHMLVDGVKLVEVR